MIIAENLRRIQTRIQQASGTRHVALLAVSKTKPITSILHAIEAGQRAFGENYVQEGVEKIRYFQDKNASLVWHFIGALQSNKTRLVAEYFDWCQTLDREKIAIRLNEQRPAHCPPLNVLIQINISDEKSKAGIKPAEMLAFAQALQKMPRLCLRGLMALPAPMRTPQQQRAIFQQMHQLFQQLQRHIPNGKIDTLSMGMTDDMVEAIESGSTMVRVGTAIFGTRS